jgi:hypothetical protein
MAELGRGDGPSLDGRRMSYWEADHLRVLIAHERKDRLALVALMIANNRYRLARQARVVGRTTALSLSMRTGGQRSLPRACPLAG